MSSFTRALRFVLAQQRGETSAKIAKSRIELSANGKPIRADIFTPPVFSPTPIIFLHGMSLLGIDDPRQISAVRALCAAGFRVICPELTEIKALRIEERSIGTFTKILAEIITQANLTVSGKVALFAPSFSGAICLRAAALPQLRYKIAAVCAIGSMSGIRESMEYLFISDDADRYAQYIVLANYLPLMKKYAPLARVFLALAHDNWNASAAQNPQISGVQATHLAERALRKLTQKQKKMVRDMESDRDYRKRVFADLEPFMEKELQAYEVISVAKQIAAPVFLLHGSADNVIPPGESAQLAPKLKRHRLVISPFIGHADTSISIMQARDVWRLISGFAYFFRHAAR